MLLLNLDTKYKKKKKIKRRIKKDVKREKTYAVSKKKNNFLFFFGKETNKGKPRINFKQKLHLPDITRCTESCMESWLNISPSSLIFGLFLCPHQFGIAVLLSFLLHQIIWERRNLQTKLNRTKDAFNKPN